MLPPQSLQARKELIESNLRTVYSFTSHLMREEAKGYVSRTDEWASRFGDQALHSVNDEKGLNAGWVWANKEKVDMWYHRKILHAFRSWGYVLWDWERLERWGILKSDVDVLVAEAKQEQKDGWP